ncbi:MAG: FAD-dependent oxidoreductase [Chloroflexota bacterium]
MKLFEPGRIGTMTVKNRIVLAAMGIGGAAAVEGTWGEKVREYYLARARGGTGLITTMLVFVTQKLEPMSRRTFMNLYDDQQLDSLRQIANAVQSYGAKLCVQLTAGFGRVVTVPLQDPNIPPVSASETPCHFNPERLTRALTTDEVEDLSRAFGAAAKRCRMAGVDAVELHGHEGYLLDQFMTGLWNRRTDRYGGSREKRLTLAREAILSIKADAGDDFPVIYRYGIDHHLPGGRIVEESVWIARQLEEMGYDALHVDAGCYETAWWPHPTTYQPPGLMVDMAEAVKKAVKIPVIAVGKMNYPALAEKTLQDGKADFIAIGRGLLADPDWPNKVQEGRLADIAPCIGDNNGCLGELVKGRPTSCTVNPLCGHELEYALSPAKKRESVLVIGGGPAGIEAACVAATRGLQVTLWEKSGTLGGNLIPAAAPEFKGDLRDLLNYQTARIRKLPIEVRLGKEARTADILTFSADHVIVATGAVLKPPSVPGLNGRAINAIDVLVGKTNPGKRVLVVGGGMIGVETAIHLAQQGHQVTLISRRAELSNDAYRVNRLYLLRMLSDYKVEIRTGTDILRGNLSEVVVVKDGIEEVLHIDSVVFCRDMCSQNELHRNLTGKVTSLYAVGDCIEPRRIIEAIWEGFHTARKLGL